VTLMLKFIGREVSDRRSKWLASCKGEVMSGEVISREVMSGEVVSREVSAGEVPPSHRFCCKGQPARPHLEWKALPGFRPVSTSLSPDERSSLFVRRVSDAEKSFVALTSGCRRK
jgi:hypothetical protein